MANATKLINDLRKAVLAQGWTELGRKNGWLLRSPDGIHTVMVHRTPSDHRWYQNAIRDLRRGGFKP